MLNEIANLSVMLGRIEQIDEIRKIAENIEKKTGLYFYGFDFSLVRIIEENESMFTILNALGICDFGQIRSMFATSFPNVWLQLYDPCL